MGEHVVKNIPELVAAIVSISCTHGNSRPWWRGHSDVAWPLVPSLYRKGFANKEFNINGRFRMMAKARHSNCPSNQDLFGWLFLMQYYRLATRLLDWSESPLVALYFVTEAKAGDETDGALWGLIPSELNVHQMKTDAIRMPGSKNLHKLCLEAFAPKKVNPDCRILSVLTEQSDLRHLVQQSVFTIHGCDTPMNHLSGSDDYLALIRIPASSKPAFRQVLALFGISRAGLFPDLENLAEELGSLDFVLRAEDAPQEDN
jgi:hypothetical protein